MPAPVAQLADGATGPALTFTFYRANKIVSLAGYTVSAVVQRQVANLASLQKGLVVLNPPVNGQAQLQWAEGDLQNPGPKPVEYLVDLILTAPDGSEEKPPLPITFTVRPSVS